MTASRESVELSVVSPMYNEQGNVAALVDAIVAVVDPLGIPFEIVLVDDGSGDQTWSRIQEQAQTRPSVRGLRLARNFGHQHALLAGLYDARGRAVVSLDGDLQHPPALIPEMLSTWRSGYKVVGTQRIDDARVSWFKRTTSRQFYRVFSRLTGIGLAAGNSDFRLLDTSAVAALREMGDADLFLRGMVSWLGLPTATLPYQVAERHSGVSKYTLPKMLRFASGALLSFSLLPLRLGIWVGFLTSAFAACELAYIVYRYLSGHTITGWASVMTFMSLMFGVLFVLLGIVGTYLGKIYEILKNRPRFLIGERTADPLGTKP
ncbi:MAG TPA: glycosyltransferase family 2 protein [Polyangiaceae bacterium]|jgi:dolichol-phosphate mannosyltransferase